jgi:hypothetical protein
MSTEHYTPDDLKRTVQQHPAQPTPLDLPGYEGVVWRNVTRQKLRSLRTIARGWIPVHRSRSMAGGFGIALTKNTGFARYVKVAAARTSTGSSPSSQRHERRVG